MREERILAIDYGEKRIGLAITDPLNIFAYPLITLENNKVFFEKLKSIVAEYHVAKIIVGNPLKESGTDSSIAPFILKFKTDLEKLFSIPVELVDERYSSEIAKQRIIQTVTSKSKRRDKSLIDKNAAAVFLEDYLNRVKR